MAVDEPNRWDSENEMEDIKIAVQQLNFFII